MGWSCGPREKGVSTRDFLQRYYSPSKIIASASQLGVTYMAVEKPDGYVFGLVVLTRFTKDRDYNFCHKEVSEDMGPFECDCPGKILDLLTEPAINEHAIKWREKCRAREGIRNTLKALKAGDELTFAAPVRFRGGAQHQRLKFEYLRRDTLYFRDCVAGNAYRLKLSFVVDQVRDINDAPIVPEA